MKHSSYRLKAFTLIELILVIIVLGIVSSITSSIIVQTYESYIMQRALHKGSLKTNIVATQVANLLSYRIKTSVQAKMPTVAGATLPLQNYDRIDDQNYTTLEWIGYDNDGFSTSNGQMGWSGFCDLTASDFNTISSLGSHPAKELDYLNNIMGGTGWGTPAIYFLGSRKYQTAILHDYNATCMHADGNDACMFSVTNGGVGEWDFTGSGDRTAGAMVYTELYQLAASAYAVTLEDQHTLGTGLTVWDLHLHTNYQPWDGDDYEDGTDNLLLRNVSVFRFNQQEDSLRIKLCSIEFTSSNSTISVCKEKAVIR